jgi:hypothetical protein
MEAAIMHHLAEQAATGEELCRALDADLADFKVAARALWIEGMIQGQLADGCCSAPCGTMCVSAMKLDRVWQLSKKGRLRLKVLAARGNVT